MRFIFNYKKTYKTFLCGCLLFPFLYFRKILERATRQKLPARKMKMLFSKWVSFEEKHGSPEKVEHVRKQALAYVNNITKNLK